MQRGGGGVAARESRLGRDGEQPGAQAGVGAGFAVCGGSVPGRAERLGGRRCRVTEQQAGARGAQRAIGRRHAGVEQRARRDAQAPRQLPKGVERRVHEISLDLADQPDRQLVAGEVGERHPAPLAQCAKPSAELHALSFTQDQETGKSC